MRKIVNVYFVCDLDASSRNPTNNFKFKNCLLGANSVVKYSDKEKYVYSGYRITFDSEGFWSFDNEFAGNVITFGTDNRKNNFVGLSEGPMELMEALVHRRKRLALILVKFCIIMLIIVICLLMENKFLSLKSEIKMLTFQHNFILEGN